MLLTPEQELFQFVVKHFLPEVMYMYMKLFHIKNTYFKI